MDDDAPVAGPHEVSWMLRRALFPKRLRAADIYVNIFWLLLSNWIKRFESPKRRTAEHCSTFTGDGKALYPSSSKRFTSQKCGRGITYVSSCNTPDVLTLC
ncbi:hypothetical protein Plhal703r1_c15g0072651 [Plasmopara halstedii]